MTLFFINADSLSLGLFPKRFYAVRLQQSLGAFSVNIFLMLFAVYDNNHFLSLSMGLFS